MAAPERSARETARRMGGSGVPRRRDMQGEGEGWGWLSNSMVYIMLYLNFEILNFFINLFNFILEIGSFFLIFFFISLGVLPQHLYFEFERIYIHILFLR